MAKKLTPESQPNTILAPRAEFVKSEFDDALWNRGYDVIHEKTLMCPCKTQDHPALATCKNCAGTGWVVIDAFQTRMVLQSLNNNSKYKSWSEVNLGTVAITALERDKLSFMDKITVLDSESIHSIVLYPKQYNTQWYAYTIYDIVEVLDCFLFVSDTQPLKRLVIGTDFTIDRNKILFNASVVVDETSTVSIRYKHHVVYGIVDLNHDIRNHYSTDDKGRDQNDRMPVSAVGRRFHYLIESYNFIGDNIFDNSK